MWRVQTQDDHRAFAMVVDRWQNRIYRLCVRMTGNLHTGEDLTQEIFARIFEKRREYNPARPFSTWLWRIALNRCYDELRRIQRHGETPLADENEEGAVPAPGVEAASPDVQAARQEEAELVRRAVLQLPDIYRSVLVLRHYENLKLREIAAVLDIPEGTVNSRMAEALAQLTRLLEPQFGRAPAQPARSTIAINPKELSAL